jgi:hypothetical protein
MYKVWYFKPYVFVFMFPHCLSTLHKILVFIIRISTPFTRVVSGHLLLVIFTYVYNAALWFRSLSMVILCCFLVGACLFNLRSLISAHSVKLLHGTHLHSSGTEQ